jgi:hypothetical protein
MRSIVKSTEEFECWMRERTDVSEKLLEKKHRRMSESAAKFLRATFYRWVERWPSECPNLAGREQDVLLAAIFTSRTSVCGATRGNGWSGRERLR